MQAALDAHQARVKAQELEAGLVEGQATPDVFLEIARNYAAGSDPSKAAEYALKAAQAEGASAEVKAEALLIRGKALVDMGSPRQAIEPLEQFVTGWPEHAQILVGQLYLGFAYLQTGDNDKARPLLEAVSTGAPEDSRERRAAIRLLDWLDQQG